MNTIKTIEIDGTAYAIPAGMTDTKLAELAGALLLLRRIDYCCDKDYRESFHYADQDSVRVRIGTKRIYDNEQQAKAARDAHNESLIAAEAS